MIKVAGNKDITLLKHEGFFISSSFRLLTLECLGLEKKIALSLENY